MLPQDEAQRGDVTGARIVLVGMGFLEGVAEPEPDRHDQDAEKEWHPPAPGGDIGRREGAGDRPRGRGRHENRETLTGELPGAEKSAPVIGRIFGEQRGRGANLATSRKALNQPAEDDDGGAEHASHRIARRQADDRGAEGHQQQRDDRRPLAPPSVGIGTQHDAAERPQEKADTVCREREQQLRDRILRREELGADRPGEEAEDDEVVEFQPIADRTGGDQPRTGYGGDLDGRDGHGA